MQARQAADPAAFAQFKSFVNTMITEYGKNVFASLPVDEIVVMLDLFNQIHRLSGGKVTNINFTSSRSIGPLSRQCLGELVKEDDIVRIAGMTSLGDLQSYLEEKGLSIAVRNDTCIIDNRFLININRYFKIAAMRAFLYYGSRGRGTLADADISDFLYISDLGSIQELRKLQRYWPLARLYYGFLGRIVDPKKRMQLHDAITRLGDFNGTPEEAVLQMADALAPGDPGYQEVRDTLRQIRRQGDMPLLLEWLSLKTVRLRYMVNKAGFSPAGFVKFAYAQALLWEKEGKRQTTFFFEGELAKPNPAAGTQFGNVRCRRDQSGLASPRQFWICRTYPGSFHAERLQCSPGFSCYQPAAQFVGAAGRSRSGRGFQAKTRRLRPLKAVSVIMLRASPSVSLLMVTAPLK